MFHEARLKLTAWYLLIIMTISLSFSTAIYHVISSELDRIVQVQRARAERRPFMLFSDQPNVPRVILDPDIVSETKSHLIIELTIINFLILGTSTLSGFFLAGRTLRPIQNMIDEQNRFITDSSHELRTPLTTLKSGIEVNLRDKKLTITEAKKLLQSNLEEVNNLQVLSDRLIKLAQYQKGDNHFPMVPVSLNEVIAEATRKVSSAAKVKDISVVSGVRTQIIRGNREALTELFVILLDNAIKYSPAKKTVHITCQKTDGHLLIKVADQGSGIHPDDIPHLFDRFYRSDKSRTKNAAPGYGLGLSIGKQIVESHHGSIRVESQPDKGSVFTVKLPVLA